MGRVLALCLAVACAGSSSAQTVMGLSLGAAIPEAMPAPDDTQVRAPRTRSHWTDLGGVSVTAIADNETGAVQFIELRPATDAPVDTPIRGIRFGTTTRAELHDRFGSEGIVFESFGRAGVFGDVAAYFTSYEIAGASVVVSFTTIEPLANTTEGSATRSVLDSLIVAQDLYLNEAWGANRGRLPNYAPIPGPFPD